MQSSWRWLQTRMRVTRSWRSQDGTAEGEVDATGKVALPTPVAEDAPASRTVVRAGRSGQHQGPETTVPRNIGTSGQCE